MRSVMQKSKLRDSFRPPANFAILSDPIIATEGLRSLNQAYISSRAMRPPRKKDESYPARLKGFTDRTMRELNR